MEEILESVEDLLIPLPWLLLKEMNLVAARELTLNKFNYHYFLIPLWDRRVGEPFLQNVYILS